MGKYNLDIYITTIDTSAVDYMAHTSENPEGAWWSYAVQHKIDVVDICLIDLPSNL